MNQHAKQIRRSLLKRISSSVCTSCTRESGRSSANVQWQETYKPAAHPFDLDLVQVKELREVGHNGLQCLLQFQIARNLVAGLDGRRLTLNVGQDRRNLRHVFADFRLQLRDPVVGLPSKRGPHPARDAARRAIGLQVLHADIVDIEVLPSRDGAHAVENILPAPRPRHRMHDHVGIGRTRCTASVTA